MTSVGGVDLVVTCTLSKFGGVALAYRPGDWPGDALDELYGIGGTETANTLISGVSTPGDETNLTATFDFACSATLGGRAVRARRASSSPTPSSRSSPSACRPAVGVARDVADHRPAALAGLRRVDRRRPRPTTAIADTLVLAGASLCATGPAVVAYADGRDERDAPPRTRRRFGRSALALGIWVPVDRGDAPASYGEAGHALALDAERRRRSRGAPDARQRPGVRARHPDRAADPARRRGRPRRRALRGRGRRRPRRHGRHVRRRRRRERRPAGRGRGRARRDASRRPVACTGPGFVAGWIDFDASGSFDAAERSQTAPCTAGEVDLDVDGPAERRGAGAGVRAAAHRGERRRTSPCPPASPRPARPRTTRSTLTRVAAAAASASPRRLRRYRSCRPRRHRRRRRPLPRRSRWRSPAANTTGSALRGGAGARAAAGRVRRDRRVDGHGARAGARQRALRRRRERRRGPARLAHRRARGQGDDHRRGRRAHRRDPDRHVLRRHLRRHADGRAQADARPDARRRQLLGLLGPSAPRRARSSALRAARSRFSSPRASAASARSVACGARARATSARTGLRSSATVRGTYWLVEDRCDGTYTRVRQGTVDVRDFRLRKTDPAAGRQALRATSRRRPDSRRGRPLARSPSKMRRRS